MLSVGLVIIFLGTPLYNSLWALGLGLFVAYFPYAFRNASGAIVNIHKELDEAAWVHGARWRHVFFKITLPILKPAVGGALFYIFIEAIRNVDVAVLLDRAGAGIWSGDIVRIFSRRPVGRGGGRRRDLFDYLDCCRVCG